MLTLYRRHKETCKVFKLGIAATNCSCPIWIYGSVNARSVRRSLNTRDWTHAHKKLVQLEAGVIQDGPIQPTIAAAVGSYLNDCEARHIAPETVRSYRSTLMMFAQWCKERKLTSIQALTLVTFSDYRAARQVTAKTQYKEIVHLRMWCNFCIDRGWMQTNHARKLKCSKQRGPLTMPYTPDEVSRLLAACQEMPDPKRIEALLLTLLYSGLRISDAVQLERSRVGQDGRLLLRMAKTGVPVYVRLQPDCIAALNALPMTGAHFFWNGRTKVNSTTGMAREELVRLGLVARVADVRPHRFRDTFAVELLLAGEDIRTVQLLLGHSSIQTTEQHYAPWVTAMQAKLDSATKKLNFTRIGRSAELRRTA
jgi:integrase/recombinase XerD